jgi:hypothetical protein
MTLVIEHIVSDEDGGRVDAVMFVESKENLNQGNLIR